jgi:hypothetical protein
MRLPAVGLGGVRLALWVLGGGMGLARRFCGVWRGEGLWVRLGRLARLLSLKPLQLEPVAERFLRGRGRAESRFEGLLRKSGGMNGRPERLFVRRRPLRRGFDLLEEVLGGGRIAGRGRRRLFLRFLLEPFRSRPPLRLRGGSFGILGGGLGLRGLGGLRLAGARLRGLLRRRNAPHGWLLLYAPPHE